jgi:tRNA (adenine58-N1)-methyltransferase non-catalytic subunit
MNTSGTGGFILHAIKVYVSHLHNLDHQDSYGLTARYDDPSASSVMAHRQKAKKARLEAGQADKSVTPEVTSTVAATVSADVGTPNTSSIDNTIVTAKPAQDTSIDIESL